MLRVGDDRVVGSTALTASASTEHARQQQLCEGQQLCCAGGGVVWTQERRLDWSWFVPASVFVSLAAEMLVSYRSLARKREIGAGGLYRDASTALILICIYY